MLLAILTVIIARMASSTTLKIDRVKQPALLTNIKSERMFVLVRFIHPLACAPNCARCDGLNVDNCLECKVNFKYTPETNECVTDCKDGFYLSPSGFCDKCNDDC